MRRREISGRGRIDTNDSRPTSAKFIRWQPRAASRARSAYGPQEKIPGRANCSLDFFGHHRTAAMRRD
jgi:hypothetical protein